MVTSEDSRIRILEGVELVQTYYKGLPKSGSQMSGTFTSSGKHIVSVGDDSRVYIWNFNDLGKASSKQKKKSENSREHFCSEGVTVAIPWSGMNVERSFSRDNFANYSLEKQHLLESVPGVRESDRFSFGSWFSIDGSCQGSMTWLEEKLIGWDLPLAEVEFDLGKLCLRDPCHDNCVLETWGVGHRRLKTSNFGTYTANIRTKTIVHDPSIFSSLKLWQWIEIVFRTY